MQLSYRVRGADGQEYGPACLQDILTWFQQGRLLPESEVTRSDLDYWAPARSFEELAAKPASLRMAQPALARPAPITGSPAALADATALPAPTTPLAEPEVPVLDEALVAQLRGGASWFFWIAGLSLINSLAALTGSNWGFVLGLGVTQVIDAIAHQIGGAGLAVGLALDFAASGLFIGCGVLARKGLAWVFVAGMALYALDGLLFLLVGDWFGLAFHVFVLFCLFKGLQAARLLRAST
jgi:hypothetical protein